jgi:hypothetical protein
MTRAQPRTHFNSSRLTRFLTENALLDAAPARDDVGQKLADWLNFRQAIALHAVLHPEQQSPAALVSQRRAAPVNADTLTRQVNQVRSQLEQSIAQGARPGSGLTRIDMPTPELDEPIEPKTAFEPYRRFYAAHQRQMETSLRTLRIQVRGQLAQSTPALQQLAALDAAFDSILGVREDLLLGKVAKLHEKRFAQALKHHLKSLAEPEKPSVSGPRATTTVTPGIWLMPLQQAMRSALMAELDTRLQPTLGLLEAFQQEHTTSP